MTSRSPDQEEEGTSAGGTWPKKLLAATPILSDVLGQHGLHTVCPLSCILPAPSFQPSLPHPFSRLHVVVYNKDLNTRDF